MTSDPETASRSDVTCSETVRPGVSWDSSRRYTATSHAATEWNAGLQVTVPLFDSGATRRRIAGAEAAHRAAGEQVRLAETTVREDVDRAAAAAEEAQARIESLEKAVERYAEVVRVQKLLLDNGAGTQIDYLNAETDLLAAIPQRVARRFAEKFPLQIVPVTVPHEALRIQQMWHPQVHDQPAHRWLREEVLAAARAAPS